MVEINPETQKSRRERLATVIAIGASAFFHLFVFFGGIQLYRWAEEEETREQLMVVRRVQGTSLEPSRGGPPPPQPRRAPADSVVKEEGAEPPPESGSSTEDDLPGDLPAEEVWEPVEEKEVETTLLVRTDLAGASFTVSGPVEFHGSGTQLLRKNLPTGDYTATFHPVPGYRTPPLATKTLAARGRVIFTGRYTKSIEISVTLNDVPGAGFDIHRPDGQKLPMNRPGRVLFDNLPKGDYTIVFWDVAGYLTPSPQTRTLAAGDDSLAFAGIYLAGGTKKKKPPRRMAALDKRVQMVVKSYPPTSIEEDFDYIRYPGIIFTRRNYQQGWCRVYLVVFTDEKGGIAKIHVERPVPEERENFRELIEAVKKSVSGWEFDRARAEVHVDVRFYVE